MLPTPAPGSSGDGGNVTRSPIVLPCPNVSDCSSCHRAVAFATRLKDADLRKGDFVQDFLDAVETTGARLRLPAYAESALRWLAAGPAPVPGS